MQIYHNARGTYRGRKGQITLPEELSPIVTGMFGFDTRLKRREDSAGPGWDACTGLGTPDGTAILNHLP
jgi:hypothetical protein